MYLHREQIEQIVTQFRWAVLAGIAGMVAVYYCVSDSVVKMLLLFVLMLSYALREIRGGGIHCYRTLSHTSSAVSAWKYTSAIWLCSV